MTATYTPSFYGQSPPKSEFLLTSKTSTSILTSLIKVYCQFTAPRTQLLFYEMSVQKRTRRLTFIVQTNCFVKRKALQNVHHTMLLRH